MGESHDSATTALRGPPQGIGGRSLLDRPGLVLAVLAATVFGCEYVVMLLLPSLPDPWAAGDATLDAALLTLILFPFLVLVVVLPLRRRLAERDRALAEVARSEQRFADIAENANEMIWETDATGRFTYCSSAVERILGRRPEDVLQLHYYDLFHPDDRLTLRQAAGAVFAARQTFHGFLSRNVHSNGRSVWLSTSGVPILSRDGSLLGYRGAHTVRFEEGALADPLTGLHNRSGFELLAEQELKTALRNEASLALVFADVDDFKQINDSLGHGAGDQALVDLAGVLRRSVRAADIVSRYGGDEFVLLLLGSTTDATVHIVLEKIQANLAAFNQQAGRAYTLSISAGSARLDQARPVGLAELLRQADAAMYAHKRRLHRPG